MRTAQALEIVRHRDRARAAVLEAERDQDPIPPFDWRAWRRNRDDLVVSLRNERVYGRAVDPRLTELVATVVHSPVDK